MIGINLLEVLLKKLKFKNIEMAQDDFFDFAKLLKGPLVAHKINTDREPFK